MSQDGNKFRTATSKRQRKNLKNVRIIFPEQIYRLMTSSFSKSHETNLEGYALAQCGIIAGSGKKNITYLVKKIYIPDNCDLIEHSSISVTPAGEFLGRVLGEAGQSNSSVLEIHTHLDAAKPSFSSIDLENGIENGRFLRTCGIPFGMMVIGDAGMSLLEYEGDSDSLQLPASITAMVMTRQGLEGTLAYPATEETPAMPDTYDRQIRIWGEARQRKIHETTAGIAGLGGTGALVLLMLARIGVKNFILIDPDIVEGSNLNRLPYAFAPDTGKKKVKVAASYLKKVSNDAGIVAIPQPVEQSGDRLKSCDVIFGCVDNDRARLALNELSLRYYIPYIDTGTEINVKEGCIEDMGGQVRVVVPGVTGCLECGGLIDKEQVAAGLMGAEDREIVKKAGYIRGTNDTPAPAVMTLNTIIASIAVQEFIDMRTGRARPAYNYMIYNAVRQQIERLALDRNSSCSMCADDCSCIGSGDSRRSGRLKTKIMDRDVSHS